MREYLISVIVPSYKPQTYLWDCLNSMYGQTLSKDKFEVILILNGCNEPYSSQIKGWMKEHSELNVDFIQTDQGGVSNARNLGLDKAKGEYITFIDDDDYVSASYLEELADKASSDTVSLCNAKSFSESDDVAQQFWVEGVYDKLAGRGKTHFSVARKYFGGPVYKLIHRDIIGNRRFDTSLSNGEDSVFMFLISDRFRYVDYTTPDAIYYRRYRTGQATARRTTAERIAYSVRMIEKYLCIYFKNMSGYNLSFFLTRLLGAFRTMIVG